MLRCSLILLLPAIVLAQEPPPVPSGADLQLLTPGQFQTYVSGIYEGQALLAAALKVPQLICVDPMMNRIELARMVRAGISRLPAQALSRPARVVVFRVLLERLPCSGFSPEP